MNPTKSALAVRAPLSRTAGLLCILVAFIAPLAGAGDDELPPVPKKPPTGVGEGGEWASKSKANTEALYPIWDEAEQPPLFVLCGISWGLVRDWSGTTVEVRTEGDSSSGTTTTLDGEPNAPRSGGTVRGALAPLQYIGNDLVFDDPYGFTRGVTAQIKKRLGNVGIEVVDAESLVEGRSRLIVALQQAGEQEAIESIFAENPAAYILYVRLSQIPPDTERNKPRVLVTLEIKRPGTGRAGGHDSFTGVYGSHMKFANDYADRITATFAEQLSNMLKRRKTGDLYKVKFLNVSNCNELKRTLEGEDSEIRRFFCRGSHPVRGKPVTDVELRFVGNNSFELFDVMQRELGEKLKLEATIADAVDGALTLSLRPKPEAPRPAQTRWEMLLNESDPQHVAVLEKLRTEYANESKPRIAVIVNYELSEAEKDGLGNAGLKQLGLDAETAAVRRILAIGVAGRQLQGVDKQALDTTKMENLLIGHLDTRYKLTLVDPKVASQKLEELAQREGALADSSKVEQAIRQLDATDVVIHGLGTRIHAAQPRYEYTFRAVRVSDGVIVGTATESVLESAFAGGAEPLDRLAAQVAAKLVDRMLDHWSPPRRTRVIVMNAKSQQNVFAIMRTFEEHLPGVRGRADFSQQDGDMGTFFIEWDGDYRSLVDEIEKKKDLLSFDLDQSGTSREALTIRIKEGLDAPPKP